MDYHLCLLPGDGIGPEVIAQAAKSLNAVADLYGLNITTTEHLIGGAAIDATGDPLPADTLEACRDADAILLGAVGGPKWGGLERAKQPSKGLSMLRKELKLFANMRPAKLFSELDAQSCLCTKVKKRGIDIMVVREQTGGIYFGTPRGEDMRNDERVAYNTMIYTESEIRRIAKLAFEVAAQRSGKVCSMDKANSLEVSMLWRDVVTEVGKDYPEVELTHMAVDVGTMQMVLAPEKFDVIVSANLFGDVIAHMVAVLTGTIGVLPMGSIGKHNPGLFQPVHGAVSHRAGHDVANPIATVMSLALMFRHSLERSDIADCLELAVRKVLAQGYRTRDILTDDTMLIGCGEMGDRLAKSIREMDCQPE